MILPAGTLSSEMSLAGAAMRQMQSATFAWVSRQVSLPSSILGLGDAAAKHECKSCTYQQLTYAMQVNDNCLYICVNVCRGCNADVCVPCMVGLCMLQCRAFFCGEI